MRRNSVDVALDRTLLVPAGALGRGVASIQIFYRRDPPFFPGFMNLAFPRISQPVSSDNLEGGSEGSSRYGFQSRCNVSSSFVLIHWLSARSCRLLKSLNLAARICANYSKSAGLLVSVASVSRAAITQALVETVPLALGDFLVHVTLALGLETIEDLIPVFFRLAAGSRVFKPQHWRESSEGELPIGPLKLVVIKFR
jgi:hypothetical protein